MGRAVREWRHPSACFRALDTCWISPARDTLHPPDFQRGEVAERSKAAVLKTARRLRASWVRIPPSPPASFSAIEVRSRVSLGGAQAAKRFLYGAVDNPAVLFRAAQEAEGGRRGRAPIPIVGAAKLVMIPFPARRGGRVAEGAPLLREYGVKPIVGSNPTLSASNNLRIRAVAVPLGASEAKGALSR